MRAQRPTTGTPSQRRRAPRPLSASLAELLRSLRPPASGDGELAISLSAPTAAAIARIAARRAGSIDGLREHPAHEAARRTVRVSAATAAQWRADAWQAVGERLIPASDALLLDAQIEPPDAA